MLSGIAKLSDLDLENKRVFVRANLDTSIDRASGAADPWLIDRLLPTLTVLAEKGARVIIGSRFGENKEGPVEGANEKAPSLEPAAMSLAERGNLEVLIPDSATSDALRKVVDSLKPGRVCVLENLAREEDTGPGAGAFARYLLAQVDAYVGDSLRALAYDSATGTHLPRLVENKAPGVALEAELAAFARLRSQVDRPRLLIWGGNSLGARLDTLEGLLPTVDEVFMVGVPANTLLASLGHDLGASRIEPDLLALGRTLHERLGARLSLPKDAWVGAGPRAASGEVRSTGALRQRDAIFDLGPETVDHLLGRIEAARAVIWCGNLGLYHNPAFAQGTERLVRALAAAKAFTVVVGDDSVAAARAVAPASTTATVNCLSEGGPSSLSLLAGKKLSGLDALRGPIA